MKKWRLSLSASVCSMLVGYGAQLFFAYQARGESAEKAPATQKVTVNHTAFVFPGQGDKVEWERALSLGYSGRKQCVDKDYATSIATFEQCIAIYPYEPEFYNWLAVSYYARGQSGDLQLAEKQLRKAIELKPDSYIYWDNLAKGLAEQDKLKETKDALEMSLRFNPPPAKLNELKINIEIVTRALKKAGQEP